MPSRPVGWKLQPEPFLWKMLQVLAEKQLQHINCPGKQEAKGLPSALPQMPVSRRFDGCHTLGVQVGVGHNLSIIREQPKATSGTHLGPQTLITRKETVILCLSVFPEGLLNISPLILHLRGWRTPALWSALPGAPDTSPCPQSCI